MTKFICDFPWIHFSTFPQGNCTVCCVAKHSGKGNGHSWNIENGREKILTVTNSSIDEIVNCDNYKTIRLDMLNGKVPAACEGCSEVEKAGGTSKRQYESHRNLNYTELTSSDGSITPDLRHIELRLGNYCNLKCRSCNADSSTSWIQDYYKLKDHVNLASGYHWIKSNPVFNFEWTEDDNFYTNLISAAPNLEQIHISGGEPFLVPKHFLLLEKLISENRTDIEIHYHTNLNYNFEKIKPTLDLLTKFKSIHMSFSIDDVGDRNTYIRSLSDWDLTIKNLKLITENYNFVFRVTQTISAYNFMYIEELTEYLKNENIDIRIKFNHVHSPDYLMATILPKEVRQEKIKSIESKITNINYHDLMGHYFTTESNGKLEYFKYFTNELDSVRNESLKTNFSKLIRIIQ
jgi:sulfatase maturation enzyme AslB (radical SAM superfamily)